MTLCVCPVLKTKEGLYTVVHAFSNWKLKVGVVSSYGAATLPNRSMGFHWEGLLGFLNMLAVRGQEDVPSSRFTYEIRSLLWYKLAHFVFPGSSRVAFYIILAVCDFNTNRRSGAFLSPYFLLLVRSSGPMICDVSHRGCLVFGLTERRRMEGSGLGC